MLWKREGSMGEKRERARETDLWDEVPRGWYGLRRQLRLPLQRRRYVFAASNVPGLFKSARFFKVASYELRFLFFSLSFVVNNSRRILAW